MLNVHQQRTRMRVFGTLRLQGRGREACASAREERSRTGGTRALYALLCVYTLRYFAVWRRVQSTSSLLQGTVTVGVSGFWAS